MTSKNDPVDSERLEQMERDGCPHRWDMLSVVGGWGDGGVIQLKCKCGVYLSFFDEDRLDPAKHWNDDKVKARARKSVMR